MIIVFFHVLYLIGKLVYKNYRTVRFKESKEMIEDKESSSAVVVPVAKKMLDNTRPWDPEEPYADEIPPSTPRFSPPAYIQRYVAVKRVLTDPRYQGKIKKVVDFGCSELGFVNYLKNTHGIEEIVCVDIDRETLERHKDKAIPLNADYLQDRTNPLTIHVYEGSVTQRDRKLANTDAVVAIELVEHLYPDALMDLPYSIFGYIKPLVAVITTPNADFNVLFNMTTKFRHWDHKFEWTRQEFEDWGKNIALRYPEYDVSFEGISPGPPGTEKFGCCSQMAIFQRVRTPEINTLVYGSEDLFKVVTSQKYPHRVDNRSDEEKILDEASYFIRYYAHNNAEYSEEYPLSMLMQRLEKFHVSVEVLREILSNGGWTIIDRENEGPVIICPEPSTFSDYEDELDNDIEDDNTWPESSGNPSVYDDQIGTWGDDNVEMDYDERWDDECEIVSNSPSSDEATERNNPENVEYRISRTIDTEDFDGIEILSVSHVPSSLGADNFHVETFESEGWENSDLADGPPVAGPRSNWEGGVESASSIKNPVVIFNARSDNVAELPSLCSIYMESSRNEDEISCPVNITNPSFECDSLVERFLDNSQESVMSMEESTLTDKLSTAGASRVAHEPQFASSPRLEVSTTNEVENEEDIGKSASQTSLQSSENASTGTTNSSTSFRTVKRWYPAERSAMYSSDNAVTLKGGTESSGVQEDDDDDEERTENDRAQEATRLERQKATPDSLNLSCITSSSLGTKRSLEKVLANDDEETSNCSKRISQDIEIREQPGFITRLENSARIEEILDVVEPNKSQTSPETPPNSWSPEIMDSGYPNTASIQDTTPEYDLSSIAQDRISESDSPSLEEPPHPDFPPFEVENGDLANNNRDGEGNNVMAAPPIPAAPIIDHLDQDLQPLIDVLENDIENENDIYAVENGFPIWLLRILERGNAAGRQAVVEHRNPDAPLPDLYAAGDAGIADQHELFDLISSDESQTDDDDDDQDDDNEDDDDDDDDNDDDHEDEDDDENIEISTESSEGTIYWNTSGDHH